MNLRKHRNLLFWFISVFQIILLALPLGDVAKRVIEYQVRPTYYTRQSSTGEPMQDGSFAKSLNNALFYTYFDFNKPFTASGQFWGFTDAHSYAMGPQGTEFYDQYVDYCDMIMEDFDTVNSFYSFYRLSSYNLFDFNYLGFTDIYIESTLIDETPSFQYGTWIQYFFFNWYINYMLSILVITFVPCLFVYIYSWFTELGYLALPRRKENEK